MLSSHIVIIGNYLCTLSYRSELRDYLQIAIHIILYGYLYFLKTKVIFKIIFLVET